MLKVLNKSNWKFVIDSTSANQQSLSTISKHKKAFSFLEVIHWCDENKSLCKVIHLHPKPVMVLATEQQQIDLERFACCPGSPPISADPTFNLDKVFVTPITYRNNLLKSKRTGNPGCFVDQC